MSKLGLRRVIVGGTFRRPIMKNSTGGSLTLRGFSPEMTVEEKMELLKEDLRQVRKKVR